MLKKTTIIAAALVSLVASTAFAGTWHRATPTDCMVVTDVNGGQTIEIHTNNSSVANVVMPMSDAAQAMVDMVNNAIDGNYTLKFRTSSATHSYNVDDWGYNYSRVRLWGVGR